ncbi:MAG: hypothetical protein JSW33_13935 [bacterium]|nr:MAG: hypothetical protein JSW33_13935 [bacterium]
MNHTGQPSYDEFKKMLTPRNLKEIQIIYFALGTGVVIFMLVLIFTYFLVSEFVSGTDDNLIFMLTLIHLLFLLTGIPLSKFLFKKILNSAGVSTILTPAVVRKTKDSVDRSSWSLWNRIRLAHILRLALFESIAVFGLIICTLATFSGVIKAYPIYWINLVSSFLFIMFLINNFPNAEKLQRFFMEYIQDQPLYED